MSALHQAALSGNIDIMRLLLEHGAVVDISDSNSKSPTTPSHHTQSTRAHGTRALQMYDTYLLTYLGPISIIRLRVASRGVNPTQRNAQP